MSILVQPTAPAWPMPQHPVRLFTVDEYHRMIQTGIVADDESVELLEGWITPKMPHNPPHDSTVGRAIRRVSAILPPGWIVRSQVPITTPDSEPEPDVAAVPGPDDLYDRRHPEPAEVGLLVEVSESSLSRDRGQKLRIYARAGIVCYWIINLVDRHIEVYTNPSGPDPAPTFGNRTDYRPGDSVPVVIAGQACGSIAVNDLLPRP